MSISHEHDFFFQWHLTERCNLRCAHCYQEGKCAGELSLSEIGGVVDEIADMLNDWTEAYGIAFSPAFNITGGEPFLRDDLADVLALLSARGFAVYVLSNGTLIDSDRAKMLSDAGVEGVQVSMEGPEEVHDSIRGSGSFSAAVRGVRHLVDTGLRVTLNTTLSEMNAGSFGDMVSLSHALGVQCLGFSRLVPSGVGAGLLARALKKERAKEIYEEIFSMETGSLSLVTGDPVASQMRSLSGGRESGPVAYGGCAAAVSGLTLLADGTIVPCRRLPVPLGNVLNDSLREVWALSPVLEKLRDKSAYRGKCGTCSRWAVCRGCRAIAYAFSCAQGRNDFLAEDPQCFIQT